jgi:beta-galactosidase
VRRSLAALSIAGVAVAAGLGGSATARMLTGQPPARPAARAAATPATSEAPRARSRVSLDRGWRFALGDAADMTRDFGYGGGESYAKVTSWRGPIRGTFDDSAWRALDLPHDWVPELPFVDRPRTDELVSHGFKPVGRGFPATSVGWYRRRFSVPATPGGSADGRRFRLEFDGVFRDCQVWLNGVLLGRHEGGYAPFDFDATDLLRPGAENLLVVRVDATQSEGWFYEGAGIYRHVWLVSTAPVHVPKWGVFVEPVVTGATATVGVTTAIANDSEERADVVLESQVVAPDGRVVATLLHPPVSIAPWQTRELHQASGALKPVLWSLENPALYRLVTVSRVGGVEVDRVITRFGIRTIRFDPDEGFFLNGRRVQINGVCNHQDHAGVGAAVPDRLARFRLERLKEMGVNAYRTSHNPPATELLDAADEMGVLVMDETRLFSSSPMALEHLAALVRRDRNHPSVILWSIGNEEPEQGTALGHRIARTMLRTVKALDASRPVTYASNSGAYTGVNELMDVRGFNYYIDQIDRYHKEHPAQPLVGSEIASTLCTRGEYGVDKTRGYMSAYDTSAPPWGELAEQWMKFFMARPWLAGAFVWTGFDYRGEPTPYEWPCISSHFGVLDTCGFAKDLAWYYRSWWTSEPVLHLLPHWNWKGREGQPIDVWAFSNMDEVRLLVNGRDAGVRAIERYGHAEWKVPFEPGKLEAVGYRGGREVTRTSVETTDAPVRVMLSADRTAIGDDGADLSVITVWAVDAAGRMVPVAANDVSFDVKGPGRIIGVGNGDPSSHEPDTFAHRTGADARWRRRLFNGLAQVIVQSSGGAGEIVLRASSSGLGGSAVTVTAAQR